METRSEAAWLRLNAAENLAAFDRVLSAALGERADHASHVGRLR